jgi:hypothetical protein
MTLDTSIHQYFDTSILGDSEIRRRNVTDRDRTWPNGMHKMRPISRFNWRNCRWFAIFWRNLRENVTETSGLYPHWFIHSCISAAEIAFPFTFTFLFLFYFLFSVWYWLRSWEGVIWCDTMSWNAMEWNGMECDVMQYNVLKYNVI